MSKLRMGMIGGGPGAFIGPIHRLAATLDGEIELVAGAFSADAERSRLGGLRFAIDPERTYADFQTLFAAERKRADGINFITIATPNHTHLAIATAALEAGIPVLSDKPATASLAEARDLARVVASTGVPYGLTYTYSGYPLVRQARAMVRDGAIGAVRKVIVEYSQGWLASAIEASGDKQAGWRVDAARAGVGGCIGDIGVHAFHLAEFVSGLAVQSICADLAAVVPGRELDDDCTVLLRFDGGARGVLIASQIALGEDNGLSFRVYGESGSLKWRQEEPNRLEVADAAGRIWSLRTGSPGLDPSVMDATRLPAGHPEGYLEAFANLYRDFANRLRGGEAPLLPGIADGLRSMAFVECAVAACRAGHGWVPLDMEEVA